jgi:hypothetical protein
VVLSDDILDRLRDLHKRDTVERSYYIGRCVTTPSTRQPGFGGWYASCIEWERTWLVLVKRTSDRIASAVAPGRLSPQGAGTAIAPRCVAAFVEFARVAARRPAWLRYHLTSGNSRIERLQAARHSTLLMCVPASQKPMQSASDLPPPPGLLGADSLGLPLPDEVPGELARRKTNLPTLRFSQRAPA